MTWLDAALMFFAGVAAGTINSVVGSGSLVTFPVLVALGYPPVVANVTNNIGVLPGSIVGAIAYRRELAGQWRHVLPLAVCSAVGGTAGAILLLTLPASAFNGIVPVLIVIACVLVIVSPWLKRWSTSRRRHGEVRGTQRAVLASSVGLTGVYGGYFGAAQGVILLSILSVFVSGGIQRANGYKNVLAAVANASGAIVFALTAHVAWLAAGVVALGAAVGGQLGGLVGHKLPPIVFRIVIVAIGIVAIVYFYLD